MKNKEGFTLIEILIVLVIIGITLGFALLAFGDFGAERRIIMAAEQFMNYVKFVQEEAILSTNTLGIRINNNNYQVVRYQAINHWQTIPSKNAFRPHTFPNHSILHFNGEAIKPGPPQIVINASGEMNHFILTLGTSKRETIIKITGTQDGAITLQ